MNKKDAWSMVSKGENVMVGEAREVSKSKNMKSSGSQNLSVH